MFIAALFTIAKPWKIPWCWERLMERGEGDNRGRDGWMASLTQWTWVWVNSGDKKRQGRLVCCSPQGHKELNTTEQLNNNKWHGNNPSALSVYEWIKKCGVHKHTGILHSHENEFLPFVAMWMDLNNIMLSEVSQIEKNTVWYQLYVGSKNNINNVYAKQTEIHW